MSMTHAPDAAWPAAAISQAEAPMTADTDRYMRAAAQAVARAALAELDAMTDTQEAGGAPAVLALAGGGHNGADTLLAAALLAGRGRSVTAALSTSRPLPMAVDEAVGAGVVIAADGPRAVRSFLANGGGLVLDGLTGIGASGALRPRAAALIAPLRAADERPEGRPFRVLAVDLPSGTGVDEGALPGPVLRADRTVTFTCLKGALCLPPACHEAGRVEVVDLGLPLPEGPELVSRPADAALAGALRVPGLADHKYTRGVVGLWAGSASYPGAALLAASGAGRAGAGMVRLCAPHRVADLVVASRPEVVPMAGRSQALVMGPGIDTADGPRAVEVRSVLDGLLAGTLVGTGAGGPPIVIDAGGLSLLAELMEQGRSCRPEHILTPHAGEAAALLTGLGRSWTREEVEAHGAQAAGLLQELTGATVVLKGEPTLIASAGVALTSVGAGPGWMATAGSGDVLSGILGALLAGAAVDWERRGGAPEPKEIVAVVAAGVRLHARAGALASGLGAGAGAPRGGDAAGPALGDDPGAPILALDIADAIPGAWAGLASARGQR
ncbi:bifunctional ADP-dependent NAD(P)H-hydrate dehydratase/NAD(P)H-hydrate epimerase [Actinomyces slackii]|nr:bifunctional ADP-dependent NAD(P)H-hydrate dehydratase/NAD(P)H-hydrate epimerase [Actinomyces slackii]